MNTSESLAQFGLVPSDNALPYIRELLAREAEAERAGNPREDDLALLCCVQLFSRGLLEDILRMWDAKQSGWDLGFVVDVQFLCGAGLAATKAYLAAQPDTDAKEALAYIEACEKTNDFEDFSPETHLDSYHQYFGVE